MNDSSRHDPRNEPNVPVQANHGPVGKAQKVRSSRYEWEGKSNNENEKAASASSASRRSLIASIKLILNKFFAGNRESEDRRNFFDNDDDASPSAA
jgi:hypothetical protein